MRRDSLVTRAVLFSLALGVPSGCATSAFGPPDNQRVDDGAPFAMGGLTPDLRKLEALRCAPAAGPSGRTEGQRLRALLSATRSCTRDERQVHELLRERPALSFFVGTDASGAAHDVARLVSDNETVAADDREALDAMVRNIVAVPIVNEVEGEGAGAREVRKARVDFALLEKAIEVLGPSDADQLELQVTDASRKLQGSRG